VPEQTATGSLEQEVRRLLELLDTLDMKSLAEMLTDDAQSVDEITRGWTRGRAAIEGYLSQLEESASDVRVLDATGNLKAVQKLLGHSSIQTTGDIYADWDIDQLARTLADVLADEDE